MPNAPPCSTGGAPGIRSACCCWPPRAPPPGGGAPAPGAAPRPPAPRAAPPGSPAARPGPAARPSIGTPSPGCPTRLRYPTPAPPKVSLGAAAVADASSLTMRVPADVMPPAHAAVAAGIGASKCRCQTTKPVSLSIAYTLFELPVTSDIGTNRVTPLALTPCERPPTPRGWLLSFTFHWRSKPGFDIASTEILSSARIHDVRCASASAVSHWEPPRPGWVKTTVAMRSDVAVATIHVFLRIEISFRLKAEATNVGLLGDAKTVEDAVERRDVRAAIGDRQPAEVIP